MRIHERIQIIGSGDSGFSMTNPNDCTVYLLECGYECAVIDAGCGIDTDLIVQEIIRGGHQPEDVESIFLTHGHGDHAGGAAALAGICHAKVYAMKDTASYISGNEEEKLAVQEAVLAGIYEPGFHIPPAAVFPLADGQIRKIGDLEIRVRLMEGHCSGHGCYEVQLGGKTAIFAGDSVFCGGKISLQAIWDCDLQKYIKTCRMLEQLHPDLLLPSHGGIALSRGWKQVEIAINRLKELKLPESLP